MLLLRGVFTSYRSQSHRATPANSKSFNRIALTMHLYSTGLYESQLSQGRVCPTSWRKRATVRKSWDIVSISARNRTIHSRCECIVTENFAAPVANCPGKDGNCARSRMVHEKSWRERENYIGPLPWTLLESDCRFSFAKSFPPQREIEIISSTKRDRNHFLHEEK